MKTRCFISVCFPGTLIPVNNRVQTLSTWSSSKSRGPLSSPGLPRAALVTAAPPVMLAALRFLVPQRRGVKEQTALLPPEADRSQFPLFPAFVPVYALKNPYLSAFRNKRKKCSTGRLQCFCAYCLLPLYWPSLRCWALPTVCSATGMCDGDAQRVVQGCWWPCVHTRLPAHHCCSGKVRHHRGSFAGHSQVLKPWPEAKHGSTSHGWGLTKKISVL